MVGMGRELHLDLDLEEEDFQELLECTINS